MAVTFGGAMPIVKCARCGGSGQNWADHGNKYSTRTVTCHACGGVGNVQISPNAVRCGLCGGSGLQETGSTPSYRRRGQVIDLLESHVTYGDCPACQGTGWALPRSLH